jgi:hypothetical protein
MPCSSTDKGYPATPGKYIQFVQPCRITCARVSTRSLLDELQIQHWLSYAEI